MVTDNSTSRRFFQEQGGGMDLQSFSSGGLKNKSPIRKALYFSNIIQLYILGIFFCVTSALLE